MKVTFDLLIREGNMEIFEWLLDFYASRMVPRDYDQIICKAIRCNNLHVVSIVYHKGVCSSSWLDYRTVWKTAEAGHLDALKWIYQQREYDRNIPNFIDSHLVYGAVRGGHLEILKWVADTEVHPSVSEYGTENQFLWTTALMLDAIDYGHLHILKWALDNKCPWNIYCHTYAAKVGRIDMLEMCIEKGYVILPDINFDNYSHTLYYVFKTANDNGQDHVIEWIQQHPYSFDEDYIQTNTLEYVKKIKEELIARTCHPSRHEWFLDIQEWKDIFE